MGEWLSVIGGAVIVFATTNVDDLLLLAGFFSDPKLGARSVVAGQFLGITVLTGGSMLASALALVVPAGFVALLGILPLALGLRGLWRLLRREPEADREAGESPEPTSTSRAGILGVASVTIANGGDNLGVYIPLFSQRLAWASVYAIVFALMTGLWCAAGYAVVHHPRFGARLRRASAIALPSVLVALGVHILSGASVLLPDVEGLFARLRA